MSVLAALALGAGRSEGRLAGIGKTATIVSRVATSRIVYSIVFFLALVVPFMFVLWQATTDASRLGDEILEVGVRVSGRNAGTYRVTVTGEGMAYEPGSADDLSVLIDFDPASLVLTAFGRTCSGTPYGDLDAARKFAGLFFRI